MDERLNGDGVGLPLGINDPVLGWVLLSVFLLVWGLYSTSSQGVNVEFFVVSFEDLENQIPCIEPSLKHVLNKQLLEGAPATPYHQILQPPRFKRWGGMSAPPPRRRDPQALVGLAGGPHFEGPLPPEVLKRSPTGTPKEAGFFIVVQGNVREDESESLGGGSD